MGLFALVAFWGSVVALWMEDGPKIPLIFIALWIVALFSFPLLGLGGYLFMSLQVK